MNNDMKDIRKALEDEFEMTEELKSLVEAWAIARSSILTFDNNPFDSNLESERSDSLFFDRLLNEIDQFAEKVCDNLRYNDGVILSERQEIAVYSDVRVIAMHVCMEYVNNKLRDITYASAFNYLCIDFLARLNVAEALQRAEIKNEVLHRKKEKEQLNDIEELDFSDIQKDFDAGKFMQDMTSEFVGEL